MLMTVPRLALAQTVPFLGDNASTFILYTATGALDNVGTSTVYGNVGTNNTGEYMGFTVGTVLFGTPQLNNTVSILAAVELQAAYTTFATTTVCGTTLSTTLSGPQSLSAGTYCTGDATSITGDITLDGDANAVFLFKIGGALSLAADARIILTGGAKISNVYFQVDGAVNINTGAVFRGTVVANGAIEFLGNSTLYGKALSTAGAIHLHNNLIASTQGALPVTLVSFNATRSEKMTAQLTWTTTAETNSDRFEIQNSLTGKDWQTAGTVKAHGESKLLLSYSYAAEQIGVGTNYYRLKMIDQDESFTYSRIRTVEFSGDKRTVIYPNPAVDKLTIEVDDVTQVQRIQLNDTNGKIMYDRSKTGSSNLKESININSFPSGIYVMRITKTSGTVDYIKVLKH